jgi:toxin YoeB
MSKYRVDIKEQAQLDLQRLLHNEPKAYQKALALIGELYEHPLTGTGKSEPLSGDCLTLK